jgi:hypothetical protein
MCCDNTLKQATTTSSTSFPICLYQLAYAAQATWVYKTKSYVMNLVQVILSRPVQRQVLSLKRKRRNQRVCAVSCENIVYEKRTNGVYMKKVVRFRIRRQAGERCFSIRVKSHVSGLLSNVRRVPFQVLITLSALFLPAQVDTVTGMWVVAEDTRCVP